MEIWSHFFKEKLEIKVVVIVTSALIQKEIDKRFSFEKDENYLVWLFTKFPKKALQTTVQIRINVAFFAVHKAGNVYRQT